MNDKSRDFRQSAIEVIKAFTGQANIIAIPRVFVSLTGDYVSAAILNQILYWSMRTQNPEGWFHKTYQEWHEELGLTQYQVSRAVKGDNRVKSERLTLSDLGVETAVKRTYGGETAVHYRIDIDVFLSTLSEHLGDMQFPAINNVDFPQPTLQTTRNQQSLSPSIAEITAKTTTETLTATPSNSTPPLQTEDRNNPDLEGKEPTKVTTRKGKTPPNSETPPKSPKKGQNGSPPAHPLHGPLVGAMLKSGATTHGGRAGMAIKALCAQFPSITLDEYDRYINWFKAKFPNGDLPLAPDTVIDNFTKFRNNGSSASSQPATKNPYGAAKPVDL